MNRKTILAWLVVLLAGCDQRANHVFHGGGRGDVGQTDLNFSFDLSERERSVFEGVSFVKPDELFDVKVTKGQIVLKDTDREVLVSSGLAPDDYYLPNGLVNDEKYAEQYVLITLEVFDFRVNTENDWPLFFQENMPEIISARPIENLAGNPAVEPTAFAGIVLGNRIALVAVADKVILLRMLVSARDEDSANHCFDQIVISLN
ncbi:MAG: hypothetical protein ACOZBH_01595 [Patescibacteria group bacterium]